MCVSMNISGVVSRALVLASLLLMTTAFGGCRGYNSCTDALCTPDFGQDATLDSLSDHRAVVDQLSDTPTGDGYTPYSGIASITPNQIHFGSKVGIVRLASVTITNTGEETLTIHKIFIPDQEHTELGIYKVIEDPGFKASSQSAPADSDVAPNESVVVTVSYLKIKPNVAGPSATLIIQSSGMDSIQEIYLDEVTPGKLELCALKLQPSLQNLGLVPQGIDREFQMSLVNTSQGTCTVDAINILDCHPEGNGVACPDPSTSESSTAFETMATENIVGTSIEPGGELPLQLKFTSSEIETGTTASALLVYKITDAIGIQEIWPQCEYFIEDECQPNLTATTYEGPYASPDSVSFGSRVAGCEQSVRQVCLFNNGPEVNLNSVNFDECTTEFAFSDISPDIPTTLPADSPFCIDVKYSPTDEGEDQCYIRWMSAGLSLRTMLSGRGSDDSYIVEEFLLEEDRTEFEVEGIPRAINSVRINHLECSDGWSIGGTDNQGQIVAGLPCLPMEGDFVEIEYDVACPE